ncbi:MAG: hypothetical protein IJW18_02125 [Lachnospiraceae bacterium]|nr:hypothetical protein [Lachnospiraceae bacterium]
MKGKNLSIIITVLVAITVMGCNSEVTKKNSSDTLKDSNFSKTEEKSAEDETTTEKKERPIIEIIRPEADELTFKDLAKRHFGFSSGAGGWGEEFTIEKDGYFTGNYHDTDMGDIGEGYEYGTMYVSSYSGHFTDITKINDHTYRMKLADISYEKPADTVEIIDNVRYIYTDAYCLGGTDTFTVYLPGTPISELSEEIYWWVSMYNQSESELTMIVIADEKNGYGIYSHDRVD